MGDWADSEPRARRDLSPAGTSTTRACGCWAAPARTPVRDLNPWRLQGSHMTAVPGAPEAPTGAKAAGGGLGPPKKTHR